VKYSEFILAYIIHILREIPNILQILTFQAFLALIVRDALIVGLTTAVLCSAYLAARDRLSGESNLLKTINKFSIPDFILSLLLGFLAGQMAPIIVKVVEG